LKSTKSALTKVTDVLLIKAILLYHRTRIDYSMPLFDFFFFFLYRSEGVYRVPK